MRLRKPVCFIAWTCLFFSSVAWAIEPTQEPIHQVKQKFVTQQAMLVDVREKQEWQAGHVEGAVLLPLSALRDGVMPEDLKKLNKNKPLYVHCKVGQRALTAGKLLK